MILGPGCELGWTNYRIDGKSKCLKGFGWYNLYEADTVCSTNKAKLPLPQTEQANSDIYAAFEGKVLTTILIIGK